MRHKTPSLLLAASLAAAPQANAQDSDVIPDFALELFKEFLDRIGPETEKLQRELGDLSGFHFPEILPNGDILIRRRRGENGLPPPKEGEIDL